MSGHGRVVAQEPCGQALPAEVRYAKTVEPSDCSSRRLSQSACNIGGKKRTREKKFEVRTVDIGMVDTLFGLTYTHMNQMSADLVRLE